MGEMDPTSRDSRRANQLFNGDAAESGASLTALRTTTTMIMPGRGLQRRIDHQFGPQTASEERQRNETNKCEKVRA